MTKAQRLREIAGSWLSGAQQRDVIAAADELDALTRERDRLREAVDLVLSIYDFLKCGTREPLSFTLKRPENETRVFELVISLNNLSRQRNRADPALKGTP